MLLPFLLGCSPFEGTWVFYLDAEPAVSGDCADEDDDDSSYDTNRGMLVDIYALASGGYAVVLEEVLTGEAGGGALHAEWLEEYTEGSTTRSNYLTLDATLEAAAMLGEVSTGSWRESEGGSDYSCESTYGFTADRITSNRDSYVEGEQ
ncbi:MAG: hypothetical protein FJ102_12550 [Deltaproteobacteria bacterium]|nr:hypothetical protein [Deltaproteobacteria bacterium]